MRIEDIISNLTTKLNKAMVNAINTAHEQGTATFLETEGETYRFHLVLDTGTYKGHDYIKRSAQPNENGGYDNSDISEFPTTKFVRYINGTVAVVDSTIEGGVNIIDDPTATVPTNASFTVNVEFLVPVESVEDIFIDNLVGEVRAVIDGAMKLNTYADFSGYNMSTAYELLGTGTRETRKGVGESISLMMAISYAFIEGGINSTQIVIRYGNTAIYAPVKAFSRVASQEGDTDLSADNNETANVTTSTTFTLSFDKPTQYSDFDTEAIKFALKGDSGVPLDITISMPIGTPDNQSSITVTMPMSFNEVSVHAQNTLNSSMHIVMGKARV